ncbi:transposase [Hymenobacter lapidiphilus]|uniref:transposase n=1 Tax=Hymenobacter sp. CCM 8763 TaxID=2303334 RepID=UPI0018F8841A
MLDRTATPSAVILDGWVLQSTPESGHRAGYDGGKRRKGSKAHIAVDTLGQLLRVVITPANAQERDQVGQLCERVRPLPAKACRSASWTRVTGAKKANTPQRCPRLTCR